jgi:hypothetical protein
MVSLGYTLPSFGQREGDILYDTELIGGINFHSNGGFIGGAMVRYTKRMKGGEVAMPNANGVGSSLVRLSSEKHFYQIGLELSFIKHPKELRYLNTITNSTFVAFKKNNVFVVRPQIGYEYVLFRKAEEEGVQVDFILAEGPSFGFLKPYYIEYLYGLESKFEAYDPSIHNDFNRILGSAGALTGIGESKIVPGFHIKPALSFELGHMNGNVTGIEVGALVEAFTEKMTILVPFTGLPPIENRQVFSSVFLTVYYGFRR